MFFTLSVLFSLPVVSPFTCRRISPSALATLSLCSQTLHNFATQNDQKDLNAGPPPTRPSRLNPLPTRAPTSRTSNPPPTPQPPTSFPAYQSLPSTLPPSTFRVKLSVYTQDTNWWKSERNALTRRGSYAYIWNLWVTLGWQWDESSCGEEKT